MLSVTGVDKNIFTTSNSIKMLPVVSAEWNQNIFNVPYITVAGDGTKQNNITKSSGKTLTTVTDSTKHPNFTTYKYLMNGQADDKIVYSITPTTASPAYKIVTYFTTDSDYPIVLNTFASGGDTEFGSGQAEITSFGWTKIETYIGGPYNNGSPNNISIPFSYSITPSKLSSATTYKNIYFTQPEVYATTYFDYQYGSVWSTDLPFTGFRPGESYVCTGNSDYNFPSDYRKVTTSNILKGKTDFKMPVSPVFSSPKFFLTSTPTPLYKHTLLTDISSYRYFISESANTNSLSARYLDPVLMNKIVLKFNNYLSKPTVTVSVKLSDDSTTITSSTVTPDDNGMLILYLNSNSLNTSRWLSNSMPSINNDGSINNTISIKQITITTSGLPSLSTDFSSYSSNTSVSSDKNRIHVVEVSPRLEVDLTNYVVDVSTNKSLDSKDTYMPISSVVTDDANITLTGIPLGDINNPIPVFSNISNYSSTKLKGLLKKNVKLYINYRLVNYVDSVTNALVEPNKIIPGGVFYSDTWQQNDIDSVSVTAFDVSRYLQTTPASDYVSNYRDAFDVISNLLDLTGFTDYDVDSLYAVCNDLNVPLNMDYYFCNSKDTTLADALNQIFLPYQIAAYIDNFGIMRFLSLSKIIQKQNTTEDISITASSVMQNGYSITNKAKPGKISLRYTTPRVKQSLSLQNVQNIELGKGPGFVYTSSNDVVWEQQTNDSVGFNYLSEGMDTTSNKFKLSLNDLLDTFHTFNLNSNGYVVVEDEIMSFSYKEYQISSISNVASPITVSVKSDLELAAAINKYIKDNQIGLRVNSGTITSVSARTQDPDTKIYYRTYSYSGDISIQKDDYITVSNMNPESLNVSAKVVSVTSNTFTVPSDTQDSMINGGQVSKGLDYDVLITPTGYITNVKRGLFGTNVSSHSLVGSATGSLIVNKNIKAAALQNGVLSDSTDFSVDTTNYRIISKPGSVGKYLFYPNSEIDQNYLTYSTKFSFVSNANLMSAGLFFNMDTNSLNGTYFVEIVRYRKSTDTDFSYLAVLSKQGDSNPIAYADITGIGQAVQNNFVKLYRKNPNPLKTDGSDAYILYNDEREAYHLRITRYPYDYSKDGEGTYGTTGFAISVFLNNYEITNWKQFDGTKWNEVPKNNVTNTKKKIIISNTSSFTTAGTKFGSFVSPNPTIISEISYPSPSSYSFGTNLIAIREIYATQKSLSERSVNYYFQDREFLNGAVQNQRLFSNYKEYIMQTQPIAIGLNIYDVQYTNGSAVSVDVNPAEYAWLYFPGNSLADLNFIQKKIVDQYAVSYSTPINTGFRAKFAAVNSSSNMIYLKHDSDELNNFTSTFSLWTHETIVPSDPEIIEYVTDPGNLLETMQIDSAFIQSKDSALKLLTLVGHSLDNFSKDISLNIFGNPMVEVGDVVKLTYPLMGINQQKYIVHSVSNSFNNGLSTKLVLNLINKGINT